MADTFYLPDEALRALADHGGRNRAGWVLRLYQEAITIDRDTTLADLNDVEADYSGYEELAAVGGAPYFDGSARARIDLAPVEFVHDGGATPNTIYGAYIKEYDAFGADMLVGVVVFETPKTMETTTDSIPLQLALRATRIGSPP